MAARERWLTRYKNRWSIYLGFNHNRGRYYLASGYISDLKTEQKYRLDDKTIPAYVKAKVGQLWTECLREWNNGMS